MKLYRVEHAENAIGPYRNPTTKWTDWGECLDEGIGRMIQSHKDDDHPVPTECFSQEAKKEWEGKISSFHSGFCTLEHLRDWFDGYLDMLANRGYVLATYMVPKQHVLHAEYSNQVAFNKMLAKRLKTRKLPLNRRKVKNEVLTTEKQYV